MKHYVKELKKYSYNVIQDNAKNMSCEYAERSDRRLRYGMLLYLSALKMNASSSS